MKKILVLMLIGFMLLAGTAVAKKHVMVKVEVVTSHESTQPFPQYNKRVPVYDLNVIMNGRHVFLACSEANAFLSGCGPLQPGIYDG